MVIGDINWRVSQRAKRCILKLDPLTGVVCVVLPRGIRRDQVWPWVQSKQSWILRQQAKLKKPMQLLMMDRPFRVIIKPEQAMIEWQDGELILGQHHVDQDVVYCLKHWAKQWLKPEVESIIEMTGLKPHSWQLRDPKSRWGSCSSKGNIMLSWRLVAMPHWVRRYVIIHELCHLKYMNHSPVFWSMVHGLCPDTSKAKEWLTQHGHHVFKLDHPRSLIAKGF